ncbi:hypothetical protein KL921_001987 [Ogataea angusta]|nr:hypothetical protein KL921_001987 [Ogataea angusta]
MSPCGLGGSSSSRETTEAVSETGWCAEVYFGGSGQARLWSLSLDFDPQIKNTPEKVSKAPTRNTMHCAADLSAKSLKTTMEHNRTADHKDDTDCARKRAVEVSGPDFFVKQNRRNKRGVGNDGHHAERRHDADRCQTVAHKVTQLSKTHEHKAELPFEVAGVVLGAQVEMGLFLNIQGNGNEYVARNREQYSQQDIIHGEKNKVKYKLLWILWKARRSRDLKLATRPWTSSD